MAALQKLSPVAFLPFETVRVRRRSFRHLLGGLLILAVWLFLWSWVAVGVLAPLGRTGAARLPESVVASLRA